MLAGALSPWQLLNVPVDDVMKLRTVALRDACENLGLEATLELLDCVEAERIESLGAVEFYRRHGVPQPVLVTPVSAHYSWSKGAKLIGLGTQQVVRVDVDERMRLDARALNQTLSELAAGQTPVLACVSVYGTTEFGTLDPVHAVVNARRDFQQRGLAFGVHVDAAWGGYLVSLFRKEDGELRGTAEMRQAFKYFPSQEVHDATAALRHVDSITVDPHKLGFIPYPAGAIVYRDREWARLQIEAAPYVFERQDPSVIEPPLVLEDLGKYVLEGSKPGSSAVSVAVAHEVFPLHADGFGRIIAQTVRAAEEFHDRLKELAERLAGVAHVIMPFEPDTNIVCIALNAVGNTDLAAANGLTRRVFDSMRFSPEEPTQMRQFIGSFTSLDNRRMTPEAARRLENDLGLAHGMLDTAEDASVFLLRHTLMNPWLRRDAGGGTNYIGAYLNFLETQLREIVTAEGN